MKAIILFIISLALCGGIYVSASGQQSGTTKPGKRDARMMREVRAVLDAQVEAWNRGDIEGFMRGYAQSSDTVFVSGDTVTKGWQTVLDRYKKSYDSRAKMGVLAFSDLEITPLGKDAAVVLGRWQLKRAEDTPHGRFSLIFRRTPAGWRIIHDHTS
jgi:uncharacterized protein (TIGR02246 family)